MTWILPTATRTTRSTVARISVARVFIARRFVARSFIARRFIARRFMARTFAVAFLLATFSIGAEQVRAQAPIDTPFRIAVIVSDVGASADRGRLERRVAEAWSARQRGRDGIFGRAVEVDVRSDGGSVERAVQLADIAIDLDSHAIVCCSVPAASVRVAEIAAEAGVPMLAPSGTPGDTSTGWAYGLSEDDGVALRAVVRDAYARGHLDLALMTLEGAFGTSVRNGIDGLLAAPGLRVVSDVRYRPDASVLTPEALRSAVTRPDAVVVWGLRSDTLLAIDGLRARGWTGPVYLRPSVVGALAGGVPPGAWGDARVMVSPASVPAALGPEDEAARWLFEARALGAGVLESRPLRADGARMHDGLTLLALAFEQVSTYGIDLANVVSVRSALRDALIGLPPRTLAAGRYDLVGDDPLAAQADGLVAARLEDGRLVPLD